ncbi:Zn-dependent hydrolase [Sporolactobacillus shoreae]|nr:Zn-dependent hydrolase [Sporolactobacillus shoreae]
MERSQIINSIRIDGSRVGERLKKLASFGMNSEGGIDRSFGSDQDIRAREWLKRIWTEAYHTPVQVDPAANLWAGINGAEELKPIVMGSHHDAVANGGQYDGAVGVLLATEVMQTLKEAEYPLRHPMKIVSFSAEEPNPYNVSTLGSRSITGVLTKEDLVKATHLATKEKITDTIKRLGGDVDLLRNHLLKPQDMSAFLECHIEQGRNLCDSGRSLAVVTSVTGIYREKIRILGEANHAGTTLMKYRHDAMLAGAELSLALESVIRQENRKDTVGTVGHFDVSPDSANIIPGEVELIAEIRTPDKGTLDKVIHQFSDRIRSIETVRHVRIVREVILDQDAVPMDETIQQTLREVIQSMDEPFLDLPSMAGHDSVHMVPIAKTGMLFVPSIEGKSHCPEEKTDLADIEKAGNVLLQTVLALDKELDR